MLSVIFSTRLDPREKPSVARRCETPDGLRSAFSRLVRAVSSTPVRDGTETVSLFGAGRFVPPLRLPRAHDTGRKWSNRWYTADRGGERWVEECPSICMYMGSRLRACAEAVSVDSGIIPMSTVPLSTIAHGRRTLMAGIENVPSSFPATNDAFSGSSMFVMCRRYYSG